MAIRRRTQKRQPNRPTEASRALYQARKRARLQLKHLATALDLHPRTVTRWETGESHPSKEDWSKVVAYLTRFVPQEATLLARAAGVEALLPQAPTVDLHVIEEALLRAADALDVSPRRVRAVVREITQATTGAHGTIADLARAAEEKPRDRGSEG